MSKDLWSQMGRYVQEFVENRPVLSWDDLRETAPLSEWTIITVDMLDGFCTEGPLASPRAGGLVESMTQFLQEAQEQGVGHFHYPCDTHPQDSPEFVDFPPHCIEGTQECELIEPLQKLEGFTKDQCFPKRSLSSFVGTDLLQKIQSYGGKNFICLGVCTDLCLYNLSLGLRMWANHLNERWRIIVPEKGVQTYDLSFEVAEELGAKPHPGELFHSLFLYHMDLNGIEIVKEIGS